jgi:hypothetical protein
MQQDRLRKRSLTLVAFRIALIAQRSKVDNANASSSLKAQGKGIMRPELTGSLLRNC